MNFPVHFSNQLREHLKALRKERGLTQAALGQLLGVGQARIAEIEGNPAVISVDQLMKLLSALGVSMVLQDAAAQDPESPLAVGAKPSESTPPKPVLVRRNSLKVSPSAPSRPGSTLPKSLTPASPRVAIRPKKGSW